MVFLVLHRALALDLARRVKCTPENRQSTDKVQQRTDLEDVGHGQVVHTEQDHTHGKVHGHTQEGHHTCPVLFRDRLSTKGTNGGEIHARRKLKQQEGHDGVGTVLSVEGNEAKRRTRDKQGTREKGISGKSLARRDLECNRPQHGHDHHAREQVSERESALGGARVFDRLLESGGVQENERVHAALKHCLGKTEREDVGIYNGIPLLENITQSVRCEDNPRLSPLPSTSSSSSSSGS